MTYKQDKLLCLFTEPVLCRA
uniref:Uncharacterized protein n=1 Tax=Arundo donax TaxID=35708 RepID=A0A0A8ZEX3_ARUDO